MKLKENLRWAAIALGILGGTTNALACVVTPDSILTEGQTLQLVADCTNGAANDRVQTISWNMSIGAGDPVSVTGNVTLAQTAAKKVYFTTPVGLTSSGTGEYSFSVTGTYVGGAPLTTADVAKVVVKPASAAVALALGVSSPIPINAACGTAAGTSVLTMPTGTAQCNPGKGSLAISGPSSFTWTCLSLNGGTEANCFAYRGTMYAVTTTVSGGNGTVSPSQSVSGGQSATVTATPASLYNTSWSSTCGGTPSGNTFTISSVNANCTVTASFSTAPAVINGACGTSDGQTSLSAAPTSNLCSAGTASPVSTLTSSYAWTCAGTTSTGGTTASCSATKATLPVGDGSDPGTGLWIPPSTSGLLIADQSGSSTAYTTSYVPGCLNGDYVTSSSGSGCGANASYTGSAQGVTTTFAFGSGKVLGLRYMSKATAGTTTKYFKINSGDGGNLPQQMKAWLSTDATATYDATPAKCRTISTSYILLPTGPSYCAIEPNKRYYLLMSVDSVAPSPPTWRYKVDESTADFQ